jgi:phosphoglycolate phosphatase
MSTPAPEDTPFRLPLSVRMVIIDLDGTLIHTAPDIGAAANAMLEEMGMTRYEQPVIESWIGNGVSRLVKRALTGSMDGEPDAGVFERAYPLFLKHYGDVVADRSRPYTGVVEGLEWLHSEGFTLVCVTNKAEMFTRPLLDALDLSRYFSMVVAGDTLPKKKPDPMPLLHACSHFGIEPAQGGDSVNDAQAARAAGMPVILVTYGYNRGADVRALSPEAVIDSLTELQHHIRLNAD